MITPSFGITAAERVLPRLALDFTTAILDSRVTFTRTTGASNPATYVDSSGNITSASNNQPRFDHDPVTLVCKGLLVEESRSNAAVYSNDVTGAGWTLGGVTTSTPTTSPDGTANAVLLLEDSSTGFHRAFQVPTVTAAASWTVSAFFKPSGRDWVWLRMSDSGGIKYAWFNVATGVVGTVQSGLTATITPSKDGFYRCSITTTASVTGAAIIFGTADADNSNSFAGDPAKGIYFYGLQVEAGAFATSYIPTTTTALTRNADVATMTGTNFSDWFNASEGTFAINATLEGVSSFTTFFANLNSNSTTNYIALGHGGTGSAPYFRVSDTNVDQCLISLGAAISTTQNQLVGSYKANDFDAGRNGVSGTHDSSGTVPAAIDRMIFFNRNGADRPMSGWIGSFRYWPQQFTAAECAAFSKQ